LAIDAITAAASESHRWPALCHCEHPSTTVEPWYQVHTMREIEARFRAVRDATSKPIDFGYETT
jgi:hypothetical protein